MSKILVCLDTSQNPTTNDSGDLVLARAKDNIVYRMRQKLPMTIEAEELHSIGLSGLSAAVQKYDPSRRETFAGYAATRIRGAILDELRRQDTMSRWSRSQAKRLQQAISKNGRAVYSGICYAW